MQLLIISLILCLFFVSDLSAQEQNHSPFLQDLKQRSNLEPQKVLDEAINKHQQSKATSLESLALLHFIIEGVQDKGEYKEANEFNEEMRLLAEQQSNHYYLSLYWFNLSVTQTAMDATSEKLQSILKAQQLIETHKIDNLQHKLFMLLGAYHRQKGQFEQALGLYQDSLDSANNLIEKADSLTQIGLVNKKLNKNQQALVALEKALTIFNKQQNKAGIANVLYNLAGINFSLGNQALAINQYEESNLIDKQTRAKNNYAYSAIKLCFVYTVVEKFTLAQEKCEAGKKIFNEFKAKRGIAWANITIANVWLKQGKSQEVITLLKLTIDEYKSVLSPWLLLVGYYFLTQALIKQNNLVDAEEYALLATQLHY